MHTHVRTILWLVLLLVGFNFVTPDSVEVLPSALWDGNAGWTVLDDDDLDHAHNHWLASHTDFLLPLPSIVIAMLGVVGGLQGFLNSNTRKHLALSQRIPRSAPTV